MQKDRNAFLTMTDEELSGVCRLEFFKGSGNGGQKRNKTSSAVRVTCPDLGISAEDCTERSQHANRRKALHKLRLAIAAGCRLPWDGSVPELRSVHHEDYPLWCAVILDLLEDRHYDLYEAAAALSVSCGKFCKLLRRDPALWQLVRRRLPQSVQCPRNGTSDSDHCERSSSE